MCAARAPPRAFRRVLRRAAAEIRVRLRRGAGIVRCMSEDSELLRRFADEGAQEAFAELVRRKLDLVYAAALRQTGGDAPLAEDVTQAVFLALACRAGALKRHTALTGWLYTTTR